MRRTHLIASAAALVAVLAAAGCGTGGLGNRKADVAKALLARKPALDIFEASTAGVVS